MKKIANEEMANVSAILQDSMGFTWLVNSSGLLRYDGNEFKKFPGLEQFTSLNIEHVVEGQAGRIWIATPDKGLALFDTRTATLTFFDPQKTFNLENKPNGKPAQIIELKYKGGHLYLVSENQILKIDEQNTTVNKRLTVPLKENEAIVNLLVTSEGDIWCSTNPGNGIIRLNEAGATRFEHQPKNPDSLSSTFVMSIFEDSQNRIWVGGISGLDLFLPESDSFLNYTPLDLSTAANKNKGALANFILTITEDNEGALWLALLREGIVKFQPDGEVFHHFPHLKGVSSTPLSDQMFDGASFDQQQNLWISTAKGLSKLPRNNRKLTQWINVDKDNCKALAMHEGMQGVLFACNKTLYHLTQKQVKQLEHFEEKIVSIYQQSHSDVWLGTVGGGIYHYDPISGSTKHYGFTSEVNQHMGVNLAFQLRTDINGDLYGIAYQHTQASGSGVIRYNAKQDKFSNFKAEVELENWLDVNQNRMVLISSLTDTKEQLYWFNKNTQQVERMPIATGKVLASIKWQQKLWFSTAEQGLITIDINTGQWQRMLKNSNDVITGLYLDSREENLYMSIDNQLYKLMSSIDGQVMKACLTCSLVLDSMQINDSRSGQSIQGNALLTADNHFLLSSENKLLSIPINALEKAPTDSQLLVTNYRIMGETVLPTKNEASALLSKSIEQTKNIIIPPNTTSFSFNFSKVGAAQPDLVQYLFKMEGLNQSWLKADASHAQADYSLLPAGNYTFRVKASGDNGYWQENPDSLSIDITVLPPWWQTWWAYSIYLLGTIILLHWFYRSKLAEKERRTSLELAVTKEQLFANISHEFRTPLTLILGPAKVIKTASNDASVQHNVSLIERNALRLLSMVEQLLQLAQLKESQAKPVTSRHVATICHFVMQSFEVITKDKGITLELKGSVDQSWWVSGEQDALETILFNLLSNAVKYTPEGGNISLHITEQEQYLKFVVVDSGCGISKDEQTIIFNRFSRVENSNNYVPGTGIGLALVKEIVDTLGGQISVNSDKNSGATFTFTLPIVQASTLEFATRQTLDESTQQKLQLATEQLSATIMPKHDATLHEENIRKSAIKVSDQQIEHTSKPSVLIVDDNQEMRTFIKYRLANDYQVLEAENGKKALEKALSHVPDIIISDVMMPIMDGFELLASVRQEMAISHTPVILLTARDSQQSKLKALSNLADDYITKPFDGDELLIRIQSLLGIRTILQKRFTNINLQHMASNELAKLGSKAQSENLSLVEQQFLQRFNDAIEQHYTNPELNLPIIASCLAMSERQLQRKLKAVSGIHFSELLRDYRLSKSCVLLKQQEKIAITADQIGFSSSSYFVRCFKAKYGKTPNEFRKAS